MWSGGERATVMTAAALLNLQDSIKLSLNSQEEHNRLCAIGVFSVSHGASVESDTRVLVSVCCCCQIETSVSPIAQRCDDFISVSKFLCLHFFSNQYRNQCVAPPTLTTIISVHVTMQHQNTF